MHLRFEETFDINFKENKNVIELNLYMYPLRIEIQGTSSDNSLPFLFSTNSANGMFCHNTRLNLFTNKLSMSISCCDQKSLPDPMPISDS